MMRIHFYEADNVLFPVIPFKNYIGKLFCLSSAAGHQDINSSVTAYFNNQ